MGESTAQENVQRFWEAKENPRVLCPGLKLNLGGWGDLYMFSLIKE